MEEVLIDLMTDNEAFIEIMNQHFKLYYDMHEKALQGAHGLIDFTHIGVDLSNQRSPMIDMDVFEKHFAQNLVSISIWYTSL